MQRNIRQRFIFALIVSERGINGLYRAAAEPRDKGYLLIDKYCLRFILLILKAHV